MFWFISYEKREFGVPAIIVNRVIMVHPIEWFIKINHQEYDKLYRILFWSEINEEQYLRFVETEKDRNKSFNDSL
jgi:hypothetical protein